MRARKPFLLTLSVSGGLAVVIAILLLPSYAGAALAVAVAILWCVWLERHPPVDRLECSDSRVASSLIRYRIVVISTTHKKVIKMM